MVMDWVLSVNQHVRWSVTSSRTIVTRRLGMSMAAGPLHVRFVSDQFAVGDCVTV